MPQALQPALRRETSTFPLEKSKRLEIEMRLLLFLAVGFALILIPIRCYEREGNMKSFLNDRIIEDNDTVGKSPKDVQTLAREIEEAVSPQFLPVRHLVIVGFGVGIALTCFHSHEHVARALKERYPKIPFQSWEQRDQNTWTLSLSTAALISCGLFFAEDFVVQCFTSWHIRGGRRLKGKTKLLELRKSLEHSP